MKIAIIGATGAIGKDLVTELLADSRCTRIDTFVRRPIERHAPKLQTHIVDFGAPDTWAQTVKSEIAISCLGTTLRDAGSKEAQWAIDYTYQLAFARMARANGVQTFVLVSSKGADATSKLFYMRMKGALEEAVKGLGFKQLIIVRPPILIRQHTDRWGERLSIPLIKAMNAVGLYRSMAPMRTDEVARIIVQALHSAKTNFPHNIEVLRFA